MLTVYSCFYRQERARFRAGFESPRNSAAQGRLFGNKTPIRPVVLGRNPCHWHVKFGCAQRATFWQQDTHQARSTREKSLCVLCFECLLFKVTECHWHVKFGCAQRATFWQQDTHQARSTREKSLYIQLYYISLLGKDVGSRPSLCMSSMIAREQVHTVPPP